MPEDHRRAMPQVTAVDNQFGTHRIKSRRLRSMRGLTRLCSASVISTGHAFVQNIRRGHDELSVELYPQHRLPAAFAELALAI
ncbi:MAG: hypothetical protein ACRDQZ_16415 [Mycobacteriales bacterium]